MKSMLILKRLQVGNANAISGLTWGFPAITHFLGFTHALSRFTNKEFGGELKGCGVICHDYQHKTQANTYGRHSFALTRNPLTRKGETAPFNEEGKMHMTISLVIEADFHLPELRFGPDVFGKEQHFKDAIKTQINTMRIAGGHISGVDDKDIEFVQSNEEIDSKTLRKALRKLLPGFALVDRSPLLQSHIQKLQADNPQTSLLDAWLDFSAIKFAPKLDQEDKQISSEEGSETTKAKVDWEYQPKPGNGYLVPLMVGYKGISPLYNSEEVKSTRDYNTPIRFAESVYGVGQWLSPHRINQSEQLLWRYHSHDDWYLCRNNYQPELTTDAQSNNE